jgi:CRISPR system Cascade subunit CasA
VSRLAIELARGNNPTLIDHTQDSVPLHLAPPQAARFLVALQCFDVGGLISFEKGQDRRVFGSATNAPLTKGAVGIVKGDNLFQTLLLNMHVYRPGDGEPFEAEPDDTPA